VREPRIAREQARFNQREQDLRKWIRSARIPGCPYLRVFTFSRVAEPETTYSRVAGILGPFGDIARSEDVTLLVENETSCNVAKCSELAALFSLVSPRELWASTGTS
jgi:hypothetical protein